MASTSINLYGYDLKFVSDPPDALVCLICICVARDPQQMDCCGRVYCQLCLTEHKIYSNKCPQCRATGNSFVDRRSDREIKALKVRCDNLDNGCQWVGELCSLDNHLQTCDLALLSCPNDCKQDKKVVKVLRKDLKNHLTNECPRRPFQCPHCKEIGEYKERTGKHLETCSGVIIECPNGCQDKFIRWFSADHDDNCEYKPVPCRYASVGCEERPLRKDLKKHEEDAQLHLTVTTETVLKLTTKADQLENEVEQLKLENKKIQLERKLTFKVHSFNRKKKYNKIFFSSSFYSSKKGYKFGINVEANGNGSGRGTHVSVFACLMNGDNDDFLTWPFTGTVTFELLNQLEDKNHHKKTVTYPADNGAFGSKRVVGQERAMGCGFQQFISHADLDYKPDKNCQYLKDDALVFRVSAEAPDYKPWLECTD